MKTNHQYVVAIDFGPPGEFTAWAALEWPEVWNSSDRIYDLRQVCRYEIGTPFTDIIHDLVGAIRQLEARHEVTVVIDQTGVGPALVKMVRDRVDSRVVDVVLTAGHTTNFAPAGPRLVPKPELVTCLQLLLQGRRLRVAETLPLAPLLVKELLNFRVKPVAATDDPIVLWREGMHDDLVFAVALACHEAERQGPIFNDQPIAGAAWARRMPFGGLT